MMNCALYSNFKEPLTIVWRLSGTLLTAPHPPPSLILNTLAGAAYAAKGQYAEAIAAFQKRISLDGETPLMLCALGNAYAKSGKRDEALTILNKLKTTKEHVSPYDLAILYVELDDKEAALESLERAYQTHHFRMQYLKVESALDALRSETRFQDLMRRTGLPQ